MATVAVVPSIATTLRAIAFTRLLATTIAAVPNRVSKQLHKLGGVTWIVALNHQFTPPSHSFVREILNDEVEARARQYHGRERM